MTDFSKETNNAGSRRSRFELEKVSGLGKIPPQSIKTEEILLGTLISYPANIVLVLDLLRADIFYFPQNQKVCEAILAVHNTNKKVDLATVMHQLTKMKQLEEVGGMYYLIELMEKVSGSGNAQEHIQIVYEQYMKREQIRHHTEMVNKCYDDSYDPFETLLESTAFLDDLHKGTVTSDELSMSDLAMNAIKERESGKVKTILGLSTGLTDLDKLTGGLQPGQLTILAARPAMGKTLFLVSMIRHLAMILKKPVGFFSIEMTAPQIFGRFEASVSCIDSNKIRYNNLKEQERVTLTAADHDLMEAKIYIDDQSAIPIDTLRTKATLMKHKYGIEALFVDYLQLCKSPKKSAFREAEISDISAKLKAISKDLNIPVIALSQLSREIEKRPDKLPMLSDLRDSGSLEQDADNVWFLWRPAYYDFTNPIYYSSYGVKLETTGLLSVIVAKQREGETGTVPVIIKLNQMRVYDHPELRPKEAVPVTQTQIALTTEEGEAIF